MFPCHVSAFKNVAIAVFSVLFVPSIFSGLTGCIDNPLEDGAGIAPTSRTIKGTVELFDLSHGNGVYVWLEGYNMNTTTADDGSFTLVLPPPSAQGSLGEVSGIFRIFYYLGNFRIEHTSVAIQNGHFAFPSENVDEGGNLQSPVYLNEIFSIKTSISQAQITASSRSWLSIFVELYSPGGDVEIWYPRMVENIEGPMIFQNLVTGEIFIDSCLVAGRDPSDNVTVGQLPFIRQLACTVQPNEITPGSYLVFPYLLYRGQSIPYQLLKSLGTDVEQLGPDYIRIPFEREGGRLEVS